MADGKRRKPRQVRDGADLGKLAAALLAISMLLVLAAGMAIPQLLHTEETVSQAQGGEAYGG